LGLKQYLLAVTKLPEVEKSLSEGADDTGMQRYILAHWARRGKLFPEVTTKQGY
jgi:hypothetical protein